MKQILLLFLFLPSAWACSCSSTVTACTSIGDSSVIFVAEVIGDSGEGWGKGPGEVVIVEPLQNVPEGLKRATIETGAGSSCYRRLVAGERYVIISDGPRLSVWGCNPSFRLRGNEHILEAMRAPFAKGLSSLAGRILKRTGNFASDVAIPTARVELKKGELVLNAMTDHGGRFLIDKLEPGVYQYRILKDGYVPDSKFNDFPPGLLRTKPGSSKIEYERDRPGEVEIRPKSCLIRDFSMWPDGSVRGTVRGLDGKPIASLPVQVFGFDRRGELESSPLQTATTDSEGQYKAQPLPAGRYIVGVNARPYDDDNAYPATLHANGRPIHLMESESVTGIDLTVPAARTPAQLHVKALGPDGSPFQGARVVLETVAGVQRWSTGEKTNEQGEIIAPAYVGQRYNVKLSHIYSEGGKIRELVGSAVVDVADRKADVSVVMRLKEGK
jgi:5-hydroxyisourate hydrolase-like protein (transthyretin family)